MVNPADVKTYIEQGLDCDFVQVEGDGHHFEAVIVSRLFRDKSMVKQHQLVYQALGDRMKQEIHALSMTTYTPEQWTQRNNLK